MSISERGIIAFNQSEVSGICAVAIKRTVGGCKISLSLPHA